MKMFSKKSALALILCLLALLSLISTPSTESGFGFRSILPPLFAILLALISRDVILSLLGGIWLGASYLMGGNAIQGIFRSVDQHLVNALADREHAFILLFSLTLGGMVGIITAAGGAAGIVQKISRWARTPRSGQIATWAMGIFIFFDDYANTLIVGNTFRPLTDRLRISREKLSFIVDATAAPVASIALISTWIGFEVGLITDGLVPIGAIVSPGEAYAVFIETIPYRFYPLLMILLVFLIGFWNRDFGSMLQAERRCRSTGKVLADSAQPLSSAASIQIEDVKVTSISWIWGVVPVAIVIVSAFVGLILDGRIKLGDEAISAPLYRIVSVADSFAVLMWASLLGALSAGILASFGAGLRLSQMMDAFVNGVKTMLKAAIVLLLAWSIGGICQEMGTADYIIAISKEILSPHLLPALTFLISGAISFATGTSWGTLSILMPIVAPISYSFPIQAGLGAGISHGIMIGTIGAVLAGSVFGDHASPISDTTVMSSMASSADHIDHVKTQIPYALTIGVIGLLFGYLPSGFGVSPWISLPVSALAIIFVLRVVGKRVD